MTNGRAAFWRYSVDLYDCAGQACLDLQDSHGLDVNLLLFCCWSGSRGRSLADGELLAARRTVAPWRDNVIEPLRRARRFLKNRPVHEGVGDMRQRVLALELEAEQIEQALLVDEVDASGQEPTGALAGPLVLTADNLLGYLRLSGTDPNGDARDALITLISSAFPETDDAVIVDLMRRSSGTG